MYRTRLAQIAATHLESRLAPSGRRARENRVETALKAMLWAFFQSFLRVLDSFLLRPEPAQRPMRPAQPAPRPKTERTPKKTKFQLFRIERAPRRERAPEQAQAREASNRPESHPPSPAIARSTQETPPAKPHPPHRRTFKIRLPQRRQPHPISYDFEKNIHASTRHRSG